MRNEKIKNDSGMVKSGGADAPEWEFVTREVGKTTFRLPVPGGWLYRELAFNPDADPCEASYAIALAFVPDTRL